MDWLRLKAGGQGLQWSWEFGEEDIAKKKKTRQEG